MFSTWLIVILVIYMSHTASKFTSSINVMHIAINTIPYIYLGCLYLLVWFVYIQGHPTVSRLDLWVINYDLVDGRDFEMFESRDDEAEARRWRLIYSWLPEISSSVWWSFSPHTLVDPWKTPKDFSLKARGFSKLLAIASADWSALNSSTRPLKSFRYQRAFLGKRCSCNFENTFDLHNGHHKLFGNANPVDSNVTCK